jgi:circadian clock protein KaiB
MENTDNITPLYILKLYITGASPNSTRAINNTKAFCEKYLRNRYQLQIIDVYQQPLIAEKEQIIALPLLIKSAPLPIKRLIGNMSDTDKVLKGLEIFDNNDIVPEVIEG